MPAQSEPIVGIGGRSPKMILVTGASGKTGKTVVKALAGRGQEVGVVIHRREQWEAMKALGARTAVTGDLRNLEMLGAAMAGVQRVYHICPNLHPDEVAIGRALIAAAKAAGVEHFVYHSVLRPQIEGMPHHWNKLRVEEMLFESGLPFTILQPTAYMQNTLAYWVGIMEHGAFSVPYPAEARISLVDLEDVAEAAATVLTDSGHAGATYELVGTAALTQTKVADILSRKFGRPVRVESQPIDAWGEQARASGMGDYQRETLIKMFRYYERYGLVGNPNVLGWLLRRPPTTFEAFIERMIRERL